MDKRSIFFIISLSLTLFGVNAFFAWQNKENARKWYEEQQQNPQPQPLAPPPVIAPPIATGDYFVLENETIQLVFSSQGACLEEINLPLQSEKNTASIVKEIALDRDLNEPFPKAMQEYIQGGYYPLLRRTSLASDFRGLSITSAYPELASLMYSVESIDDTHITFLATQKQRRIRKTFRLNPQMPYMIDLAIEIDGDARGLWLNSGLLEAELISNAPAPAASIRTTRNGKVTVDSLDLPKESTQNATTQPDWLCVSNGFFGIIFDPQSPVDSGFRLQKVDGTAAKTRLTALDGQTADRFPAYVLSCPLNSNGGTMNFRIYAGPLDAATFKKIDAVYGGDYIATQTFHGWFAAVSEPFAKVLFWFMEHFYAFTHSWALSIILLTVVFRVFLYPLNAWSLRSMKRIQELSPKIAALQEKYKNDAKKLQEEQLKLYQKEGVNPMSGCLPILIQMPFFIGMFDLLKSSFSLRGASFVPGWIDDLAAPDLLFSWSSPIIFIGKEFHLLPVVVGLIMFVQQKFSMPTIEGKPTPQQEQQRMMMIIMPIMFTFLFYGMPSGLNLYFLSSMLLSFLQQKAMKQQGSLAPVM